MEAYRDQYARLFGEGEDVVLLAVSGDEAEAQAAWASDGDFPFLFASDPGGEVGTRYGAARSRNVFIIDAEGIVRYAHKAIAGLTYRPVDELIAELEQLA